MEEYQLSNRATPAASADNIVTEDDPGLKDDGDETTGVDSDFFHRQNDSPIKQKLVQHSAASYNDMLFYSVTTMMCFLTKEWYGFLAYTVNLFIKAYYRITYKGDLKIT